MGDWFQTFPPSRRAALAILNSGDRFRLQSITIPNYPTLSPTTAKPLCIDWHCLHNNVNYCYLAPIIDNMCQFLKFCSELLRIQSLSLVGAESRCDLHPSKAAIFAAPPNPSASHCNTPHPSPPHSTQSRCNFPPTPRPPNSSIPLSPHRRSPQHSFLSAAEFPLIPLQSLSFSSGESPEISPVIAKAQTILVMGAVR